MLIRWISDIMVPGLHIYIKKPKKPLRHILNVETIVAFQCFTCRTLCRLTRKIGERSGDGLHLRTGAVWKVIHASVHWGTAASSTLKVRFYFDRTDLLSSGVVKLQGHLKLYQSKYHIAHTMFYSCCLCLLKVGPNLTFIYFLCCFEKYTGKRGFKYKMHWKLFKLNLKLWIKL